MIRALVEEFSGYPALWLACATSGILAPMPEDFPLIYAGTRVADGSWTWAATLVVAIFGVATRDVIAWSVGRFLGDWFFRQRWRKIFLGQRALDRARRMVTRHGALAVLFGRFFIGFRAPVFAAAGAMGVPLPAFAAYDAVGLVIAVPIAVAVGYEFGPSMAESVVLIVERARFWIAIAIVFALPVMAWRMSVATSLGSTEAEEEKEVI